MIHITRYITIILILPIWLTADTIQVGAATFQLQNYGDGSFYPLTAAPQRVSVTSTAQNPQALQPPYRLRSWLGGMLWGTGKLENDYYVARNQSWVQENFAQHPVWANPIMLSYFNPPGQAGSDPNSRGINLCLPFGYYKPDAAYASCCSNQYWTTPPLLLVSTPIPNILLVPTDINPASDAAPTPLTWNPAPNAVLVDRMGDFDVDLVFQNPATPYQKAGQGTYLKLTQAQGSPYTFIESRGTDYIVLKNLMVQQVATSAVGVVPGVTGVSYALIRGNQNNPALYDASVTLNPAGQQDNFTTWAVYWKTDQASFAPGTTNNVLHWNSKNKKNYLVIAAVPTVSDYPTTGRTYAGATGAAPTLVDTYAQELGKYAFNLITNSMVTYAVQDMHLVETTYTLMLNNPYSDPTMVDGTKTVMALMPHHYQPLTLATGLAPDVLDLNGSTNFAPANGSGLIYWTVKGSLKTILGTSFKTNYIFHNFLPAMPPPHWDSAIANTTTGFKSTIGQFLFDNIDNEYVSENTNPNFAPWQTAYYGFNKGLYDIGKTLCKNAKELSLILQFLQTHQDTGKTWVEQQYNNRPDLPDRPGATLSGALTTSVQGSLTPPVFSGVEGAIAQHFQEPSKQSTGAPWLLRHFIYYDSLAHMIEVYPTSADPSGTIPFASRINNPPVHAGDVGQLWEAFGVANMLDDHHYQYGYWISAAALAALYDGAWSNPVQAGTWATKNQYGAAIDQLVMDVAYDPAIDSAFYKNAQMSFAKLNFFDQWEGHGWADGLQASVAGGSGHNENSVYEALQCYSSILLWGMATINDSSTTRKKIVDLGAYLYTTADYTADYYFFDKNLNLKPGNPYSFVPVVTAQGNPSYPINTSLWDYTIHTATSSGVPKIQQAETNYSTDFGQTPANIKFISAFPICPWTLGCSRNTPYLNAWNASMDTGAFQANIATTPTCCWQIGYYGNMNMLAALGGTTQAYGTTQAITPYQYTINLMTANYPGVPPWGYNQQYDDPCQSIAEVLHLLHAIDYYGSVDWSVYGHATQPDSNTVAATAAFTKAGKTTYVAFNPNTKTIKVRFYAVGTGNPLTDELEVKPKRWALITQ